VFVLSVVGDFSRRQRDEGRVCVRIFIWMSVRVVSVSDVLCNSKKKIIRCSQVIITI
jgi:hypothetical protein